VIIIEDLDHEPSTSAASVPPSDQPSIQPPAAALHRSERSRQRPEIYDPSRCS